MIRPYTPNFSFTAQLKNTDVELGSLDLEAEGPVDITDEKNFGVNVNLKAALNFGGKSYEVQGKLIKKDKAFYGKIEKLPEELINMYSTSYSGGAYLTALTAPQTPQEEIQANLQELFKNWIIYETKSLPTKAREELERNIESTSITNKIRKETEEFLLKSSILPEVQKLGDEKIEGVDTYHLLLKPSKDKTKQIILEYINQNEDVKKSKEYQKKEFKDAIDAFAGSFEQFHLEIWVGKRDAIVRKSSFQTQLNLGFIPTFMGASVPSSKKNPYNQNVSMFGIDDIGKTTLAFSTVVVMKSVNKPVVITAPSKSIPYDKYFQQFTEAFMTKDQREQQTKAQSMKTDYSTITKAMTLYYVDNNSYPAALNQLVGKYITSSNALALGLSDYRYKRSFNGNKFVVYKLGPTTYNSSYGTPYYGVTNSFINPHQLSLEEFSDMNQ